MIYVEKDLEYVEHKICCDKKLYENWINIELYSNVGYLIGFIRSSIN